jgi:hypothetical protein
MKKLFKLLIFSLCFYFVFQKKARKVTSVLNKVDCSTSGKTISKENFSCFLEDMNNAKTQKRIIIETNITNPILKIMGNLAIEHRPNAQSEYKTLVNNTLEVCSFLNGTDRNPIGKWIMDQVSGSLPAEYIHPCPYFGFMKWNFTLKGSKGITFMVKGDILSTLHVYDVKDSNIFTLNIDGSFS